MPNTRKKEKKTDQKRDTAPPKELSVHYIKSAGYSSCHVDGFFGGITPSGKLHVAPFVQRQVIPQIIVHEVDGGKGLGKEIRREGRQGITREIQTGLIMDFEVAKTFRDWLNDKIGEFERLQAEAIRKMGDDDAK